VNGKRYLIVTADDFGIGPATSQGILDLARRGLVTASVLLVNSPHAEQAVRTWRQAGRPFELGWHPCLTLDAPLLPAEQVPSLVGRDGRFVSLGGLMKRLCLGRVRADEVRAELEAQYRRYLDLVGRPPTVVNAHHHVQVFPLIGKVLLDLLNERWPIPYVRRIVEPWSMLKRVPGARAKRAFLSFLGRAHARRQEGMGFPGNDWLAGITDPPCVADAAFLARWLAAVPGEVVELTCHPGYWDSTLVGRDCTLKDGQLQRRVHELNLLQQASFGAACRRAGFTLVSPGGLLDQRVFGDAHAA
jgi:chitin disaccharide deacetylase